jgi:hypothetical protein
MPGTRAIVPSIMEVDLMTVSHIVSSKASEGSREVRLPWGFRKLGLDRKTRSLCF